MNKLFSNGMIDVPIVPPVVSVEVPTPDKLVEDFTKGAETGDGW